MATKTNKKVAAISRAKDNDRLLRVIDALVGRRCWRASIVQGEGLRLDLGRRVRCDHPKLRGESEGEWVFSTCGTAWMLFTPDRLVSSAVGDDKRLEKKAQVLVGAVVTGLSVSVPDHALAIMFNNKCLLRITPTSEDDQFDDVPFWELFMPKNMYVAFGPGARWTYKRSDLAVS